MAKIVEKNNKKNEEILEEGKSPGIFQKLFYLVLIPLMFVIAILLVVATITNTNVFEKASEILPFVSQKDDSNASENNSQKIVELQAQIKEKEAEIEQLQTQLDTAKAENENNQAIQDQLRAQIDELQSSTNSTKKEFDEILSTYENMSAKAAAPILVQMSDDEATRILMNMQPEKLSDILSKMSPADAAHYTELIAAKK